MIFCIDIDNTITNMNHIWLKYINHYYNTNYTYTDITHWDFFNILQAQNMDVFKFLEWKGFWLSTTIYPNAVKALETFARNGHKVRLVTASDPFNPVLQDKLSHTLKHFNPLLINKNNIVIAQDKSIVEGDVLIDDNLDICCERAERRKLTYKIHQPWNTMEDIFINAIDPPDFGEDNLNERWVVLFEHINSELKLNLKFNQ